MVAYPPAPNQFAPAGFGVRLGAYLVDALLLSLVGGAFPYLVIPTQTSQGQGATAGGGSILVSLVYFAIFWSHFGGGRTLGMRLFGLQVVGEDGGLLSVPRAVLRWIGLWISFTVFFIGVIWVAVDARKQGWHDKIARTLVVHRPR